MEQLGLRVQRMPETPPTGLRGGMDSSTWELYGTDTVNGHLPGDERGLRHREVKQHVQGHTAVMGRARLQTQGVWVPSPSIKAG